MLDVLCMGSYLGRCSNQKPVVAQPVEKHTNALTLKTLYQITVGTPQTLRNRTDMIAQNKAAHKQAKGPAPFADGGSSAAASFSLRL